MPVFEPSGDFSVLKEHIESIFGNMDEFAKNLLLYMLMKYYLTGLWNLPEQKIW